MCFSPWHRVFVRGSPSGIFLHRRRPCLALRNRHGRERASALLPPVLRSTRTGTMEQARAGVRGLLSGMPEITTAGG